MVLVSGLSARLEPRANRATSHAIPPCLPFPILPYQAMRPLNPQISGPESSNATEYLEGTITKLLPLPADSKDQGRDLEVKLNNGETVRVIDSEGKFKAGQDIEVFKTLGPDNETVYYATDYIRRLPLGILVLVFVAIATVVGRGKGFRAVLRMLACIAMIMLAIVPAIAAGYQPDFVRDSGCEFDPDDQRVLRAWCQHHLECGVGRHDCFGCDHARIGRTVFETLEAFRLWSARCAFFAIARFGCGRLRPDDCWNADRFARGTRGQHGGASGSRA